MKKNFLVITAMIFLLVLVTACAQQNTAGDAGRHFLGPSRQISPPQQMPHGTTWQEVACNETDGGINPNRMGSTIVFYSNNKTRTETDSCQNSADLIEWYCGQQGDPSGLLRNTVIDCGQYSETCSNGLCIPTQTWCNDSDGGIIYDTFGTVHNYQGQEVNDHCNGTILTEAYCTTNNTAATTTHECTGTCTDGACIPTTTWCNDSDGGQNVFVKGTTTDAYGTSTDFCQSPTMVNEYYCMNNRGYGVGLNCPTGYSCSNGACINGTIACYGDEDCPPSVTSYCHGNLTWTNETIYQCDNPGTVQSTCVFEATNMSSEPCFNCQNGTCMNSTQ